MSCGCSGRLRYLLQKMGWARDPHSAEWRKDGHEPIPDERVEEDHFRVLIETLWHEAMVARAQVFKRRLQGASR